MRLTPARAFTSVRLPVPDIPVSSTHTRPQVRRPARARRVSRAMAPDVLSLADRALGNTIERMTKAHHARRLGRLGQAARRTPADDGALWAAGDPPPREGNAFDV